MTTSAATDPPPSTGRNSDVQRWRRQWRAAAEALFPSLMADPDSYARALETIGAMANELDRQHADLDELVAAMEDPDGFLARCGARPPAGAPLALLVGVACGMRERDLIADDVRRGHQAAIERARVDGSPWAVLDGPEAIEELTGGASGVASCTHLHVPSGTELRATVDAWSPEPYRIDVLSGVLPPGGRSFTKREPWLAEFHRHRAEIGGEA